QAVDEAVREEQPAARMLPASQRFQPVHLAAANINLRLVVEYELTVPDAVGQFVDGQFDLCNRLCRRSTLQGDVPAKKLFEISQTEGLLEIACDAKSQRASQFFRSIKNPLADAAHQHDAGPALELAEQAENLHPVHSWHHQVEQDQADVRVQGRGQLSGIGGRGALDPHGLRSRSDQIADICIVIDYQDVGGCHPSPLLPCVL